MMIVWLSGVSTLLWRVGEQTKKHLFSSPPSLYHNSAGRMSERGQSVRHLSAPSWADCWLCWCLWLHLVASLTAEHWRAGQEGLADSLPADLGTVSDGGRAFSQPSSPGPWGLPWREGSGPKPSSWVPSSLPTRAARVPAGHRWGHSRSERGAAGCWKPGRGGGGWRGGLFHPHGSHLDPAAAAWRHDGCRTDRRGRPGSGSNMAAPVSLEAEAASCDKRRKNGSFKYSLERFNSVSISNLIILNKTVKASSIFFFRWPRFFWTSVLWIKASTDHVLWNGHHIITHVKWGPAVCLCLSSACILRQRTHFLPAMTHCYMCGIYWRRSKAVISKSCTLDL